MSSLTWDQVEELLDTPVADDQKANRARAWKEVMMLVNNYPGQESMTADEVRAKIDGAFPALQAIMQFNKLRNEGLKLSGYGVEEKKPGEAVAAQAS